MRSVLYSLLSVLVVICIIKLFSFSTNPVDDKYQRKFNEHYQIFALTIPHSLDFANEKVPLDDWEVKERMDRELLINTYFQSQTLFYFKKANRWFPVIKSILKSYNIPDDFIYLPLVESGLSNVVSPQKAVGYWQLLETTATEYGLEVNDVVDERYHVEKSTEAACKFLLHAYKIFNNWTLVAASYNMGITGLMKQINRQKTNSYYDLLLNEETSRYVFRIIALKEVMSNYKNYGINYRDDDLYPVLIHTPVMVDSAIKDLVAFAGNYNISYKTLKIFNPWLRDNFLTNQNKKQYILNIPASNSEETIELEKNTNDDNVLKENNEIDKTEKIIHIVKDKEKIKSIAKKYDVSIQDIKSWNGLEDSSLEPEQQIIIYLPRKSK